MLSENELIDALCMYLKSHDYKIVVARTTKEKGIDVIAKKGTSRLLIEAQGDPGSFKGSKRYERTFSPSQISTSVSTDLYPAADLSSHERQGEDKIALAFPNHPTYLTFIAKIRPVLDELDITVFLIGDDRSVTCLQGHECWRSFDVAAVDNILSACSKMKCNT
ncbi:MAG: hypothetical protein IPP74_08590 [Alphaproteobacteria bacterium]|nr:hypothetical protein [Alphaproteobacteria bacterium]